MILCSASEALVAFLFFVVGILVLAFVVSLIESLSQPATNPVVISTLGILMLIAIVGPQIVWLYCTFRERRKHF